jgi:hypothetical protein
MNCLTSAQVQAVVDGEGTSDERAHSTSCAACRARVGRRRDETAALVSAFGSIEMPGSTALRTEAALANSLPAAGATRLRSESTSGAWWRRAAWGGGALAAATAIAVLVIAPMMKTQSTVSAAGILAESAHRLASTVTSGVEVLSYELVLDGAPKDLMPEAANGRYVTRQVIDHNTPGRFRYTSYTSDGTLLSSIAEDPAQHRRTMLVNLDGQFYRFEFTLPPQMAVSLPDMERMHTQATVSMMLASGQQLLQIVDTPDGKQYRIEVPRVSAPTADAMWDLTDAQILIGADDYRVNELSVKGTFLKQAYSLSYKLLTRDLSDGSNIDPSEFEVPEEPGAITIAGQGTSVPPRDALVLALRELARSKDRQ